MIAGGIGGAFALLVGVYSLSGHHGGGVPVVQADSRPLRVKPDNAGGMQVAGKDESILSGASEDQAALAPAPEAPAPQALKAAEKPAVAPSPAPAPAQVAASQPAPAPVLASVSSQTSQQVMMSAAPVAKPVAAKPAPVKTVAASVPAAPAVAKVAPAKSVLGGVAHGPQVQLAALTSEQGAQAEWARLEKKFPELLGGRKPEVLKTERDGKTFWRLRTGGFADAGQAKGFCEQMKSKGMGCSVAGL